MFKMEVRVLLLLHTMFIGLGWSSPVSPDAKVQPNKENCIEADTDRLCKLTCSFHGKTGKCKLKYQTTPISCDCSYFIGNTTSSSTMVDGNWGNWADTSTCSSSCGNGQKSQLRTCNNPASANGGQQCQGSSTQNITCNYGIPCPSYSKAMAIGGWTSTTEIIDLTSSTTNCSLIQNFPYDIRGEIGGLVDNHTPMVCGGITNNPNPESCYFFINGTWTSAPSLTESRFHSTGLSLLPFNNASQKFFVAGDSSTTTSAIFDGTSWTTLNESHLPAAIYVSCMTYGHDSTLILTGGIYNQNIGASWIGSNETKTFNPETLNWNQGPYMTNPRYGHGCGTISNDEDRSGMSVIVVGGLTIRNNNPIVSVEILDKGSSTWRSGPNLPIPIGSGSLVTDPHGKVFLIGGYSSTGGTLNRIYQLPHGGASAEWQLMPHTMKTAREWHLAFTIPDDIAQCH